MCVSMPELMCTMCIQVPVGGRKRASDPPRVTGDCDPPCGCLELNLVFLEEQ